MAKEFNLEESSAYFTGDKIKDFVKRQRAFDRMIMSRSSVPMMLLDSIVGLSVFLAIGFAAGALDIKTALCFIFLFHATAYSLGLFKIKNRFDRWQSLFLSIKSWFIASSLTLGLSHIWLGNNFRYLYITLSAIAAGLIIYFTHWYLARGLRNHAFHFVVIGEPSPITVSLLKEVRRPREVVSYRHIHKLYQLLSSPIPLNVEVATEKLLENNIATIVLTANHKPNPQEELILIEASKHGIESTTEEELWETVTKCSNTQNTSREDLLKAVQVSKSPVQNMIRRFVDAWASLILLVLFFVPFVILYTIASLKKGMHAIEKHEFIGINGRKFNGRFLSFSSQTSTVRKLSIGFYAQSSFFERLCWKTGLWKYPLLMSVITGELSFIGSPLQSKFEAEESLKNPLETVVRKTIRPGLVSHFELTEQEPTYYVSEDRPPLGYTLYYRKHRTLLLDAYLLALSLFYKIIGRVPQRAWL